MRFRQKFFRCVMTTTACAVMASVSLSLLGCSERVDPAASMREYTVRAGTFEHVLEEAGSVEATRVISIVLPMSGRLIYLPQTGTEVREGDVIVQLETDRVEERLQERYHQLQSVEAELQATIESLQMAMRENSISLDLAQSELEFSTIRLQDVKVRLAETEVLLENAVVPEEDLRQAAYDVDSSRLGTVTRDLSRRIEVATSVQDRTERLSSIAQRGLQGRRALREFEQAQQDIDQARIESPINGIFLRTSRWDWRSRSMREPQTGEDVRRRQELGQIPDLESLVVRTQIPESFLTRVSEGDPASVLFDAHDDMKVRGAVRSIGNVAIPREESAGGAIVQTEQSSGQKVFEVLVELEDVDSRLRPGITAQVRLSLEDQEDVLTVPIEAIRTDEHASRVFVIEEEGESHWREVTLGQHNGEEVIVLDGLRPDERIGIPTQESGGTSSGGTSSGGTSSGGTSSGGTT